MSKILTSLMPWFAAAVPVEDPYEKVHEVRPDAPMDQLLHQALYILCTAVAIGVVLFVIVLFLKGRKSGFLASTKRNSEPNPYELQEWPVNSSGWFGSGRRHRRFRKHRPRNPTLAETGGLPPARGSNATDPPQ